MGSLRITVLIAFIWLFIASLASVPVNAMVTQGYCTDSNVGMGGTCTVIGILESGDRPNSTIKVQDVDQNPPYQALIWISGWWDDYGTFGYEQVVSAGNTYTYTNPSDSNDFIQFYVESIFVGGDNSFVHLGDVNYQQTFYVSTGGSDSNYGNVPGNSWLTFSKSANTLIAGTDVIVSSGTYNNLNGLFPHSGISNSPIILKGDGTYPTLNGYAVFDNVHYINVSGFQVYDTSHGVFQIGASNPTSYIYIYDNNLHATSSGDLGLYQPSSYCNVFNNTLNDHIAFYDAGSSNDLFYNNIMLLNSEHTLYYSSSNGKWNIDGNYWAPYLGIDGNGDKIGDTSFSQSGGTDQDHYPKMDRESGYVKDAYGVPVLNATVSQIGATYRNTTSDANGYYALSTIGRDTVTLYAIKDAAFGNATVTYDSVNANITIGISGYNNTNTIIFSSDSNPANEITHSAIDTYFWTNVWIQDYDPDHDYYSVRVYYPNGDLKDPDINVSDAQPAQKQYKINLNEDYGNYLFISHSYYFDEDLANNSILIHNVTDVNDSMHNCDCIDHCTPGYFVSNRFCINPYADYASMYFSSDLSGLNRISSALFNHTVYLQISHPNGDYTNYSYNISILTPTNTPFYNWTTMTEYGYASWYTPSIATGTWTVNFIRKNLTDSSEVIMNTTTLYLSQEETPPPVNLSVLSGYVREAGSLNSIYQASVVAGSYSASSNAVGYYIIPDMLDGNYTITASKTGYNSSSTTRTIANSSINNVNFILNCTGACPTPTPTGSPTPTPTGTGGGIPPGSTTDATIASNFWTMLFIVLCLYGIAFFWTIGDKE